MTPTNALPTNFYSYQRPANAYANALLTACQRLPTACLPTPHTPRSVGRSRAATISAPSAARCGEAFARAKVAQPDSTSPSRHPERRNQHPMNATKSRTTTKPDGRTARGGNGRNRYCMLARERQKF
jgi:hypothetical protein